MLNNIKIYKYYHLWIKYITFDNNDNENGAVDFLGARLRITINSKIDNLAAGNMAVPINLNTGLVIGPGVFSDITKDELIEHPITKVRLLGFKVLFLERVLNW